MKIALCNKKITKSTIENRKKIIKNCFKKASENNVDIIIMPESYLTGYNSGKKNSKFLNKEDSIFKELTDFAAKLDLSFIIGFNEEEKHNYYISSYAFDVKEKKCYVSRKTHLGIKEKRLFKEGEEISVFKIGSIKVGVTFCHEIHIPEIFNRQSLKGAVISFNISAAPSICGNREDIWNIILPTRGLDSRMNVTAVNYSKNNRYSLGAAAADSEGNYIYEDYENDGLHIFEINLSKTIDIRNNKKKYYPKKLRWDLIEGE
ncbi:MAG: carbon-nitrogen hydrolase family protein [Eubacteriales bacterium]